MMLEVCVDSVQAAIAARDAGADRLELCMALDIGGVTPNRAFVDAVRMEVDCPLIALVRPRAGNFVYDTIDAWQMRQSILELIELDIQGFAIGACDATSELDQQLLASLISLANRPIEWVMHRAFDYTRDPAVALEQLIELGFHRVLTSGGLNGNAYSNIERLSLLKHQAAGRITILPGGGITAVNAEQLLRLSGCRQLHGSFRLPIGTTGEQGLFGAHHQVDRLAINKVAQLMKVIG